MFLDEIYEHVRVTRQKEHVGKSMTEKSERFIYLDISANKVVRRIRLEGLKTATFPFSQTLSHLFKASYGK